MAENHYRIRPSTYEELGLLAAIEQRAGMLFAVTRHAHVCAGPFVPLAVAMERRRTGFVLVAADRNDVVVGFALGGELNGEAFLQELDVEPAHGRRGLGQRLVHAVFAWARQRGCPSVMLSTYVDVPWNAPFYARLGFEAIPENQLTPAMHEVRNEERKAGLFLPSRVFMRLKIERLTAWMAPA